MFTRSNRDKGKDAEAALRAEIVVLGLLSQRAPLSALRVPAHPFPVF
jgi:hypothetical protein